MKRRYFRNFVFYPFAVLTGLITALWLATPFVAEHYLIAYFHQQGEDASIGKLSVDFFPPKVDLKNITINNKTQDTLTLKRAIFEVEILPLLTKTVHISEAKIEGLNLLVAQQENHWIVAGIDTAQYLAKNTENEPKADDTKQEDVSPTHSPWKIKLPAITVTDSQVNLSRQQDLTKPVESDTFRLSSLSIKGLSGHELNWKGNIALSALVNQASLSINSDFDYTPEQANADISIKNLYLPIESFHHFLPSPFNEGKGQFNLAGKFQFHQKQANNAPVFSVNNLNLEVQVAALDLHLNETDHLATQSTSLTLTQSNIEYISANQLSITGAIALQSEQSHITQADQVMQFGLLSMKAPLDIKRDVLDGEPTLTLNNLNLEAQVEALGLNLNETDSLATQSTSLKLTQSNIKFVSANLLSVIGTLELQSQQSRFTQTGQVIQYGQLNINTPLDITRDALGLTAKSTTTKIDMTDVSVALDSLAVENGTTQIGLSNLTVAMDPQEALTASLTADIQSNNLSVRQAGNTANYDVFNLSNTLSVRKEGDSITAQNTQLDININGLKATQIDGKQFSLGVATLTAEQLNVKQENQQPSILEGVNLNFSSQLLDSLLSNEKRAASWKSADVSGLSFTQQDPTFDIKFAQLNIADLTLSQTLSDTNDKQPQPALSHIGSIKISEVEANQDGASINTIATDSVNVNLIIDKQKRLENLVFIKADQQKASQPSLKSSSTPREKDVKSTINKQDPAFKAPYYVILEAYDTTGTSSINVQDKSISPTLLRSLEIETLSLRKLNTKKKDQATVLALRARNGKYAILQSDITIWPLADKLTMKSELIIKEAELPPYSSYIANILGYQIDSGQLDLDLKLDAENGVLDGNSHILLREFDLGGRKESNSVIKAGAIPLNIAVSILKDSKNNIDLDIPLSGDIDNPEFGWQDFLLLPVRKALFTASSSYLMQTFVPYANVISIAQFAGDQLLKIRVEPLLFEAKESNLNASQDVFIKQLIALMKDKKDSQLKACGVASYLDLGFDNPPVSIDDAAKDIAKNLAQERAHYLKDHLVKEGISSSRIYLCSPEIDLSKSSQPRVELNF
ncbi:DUF748 domain-containing protein [Marinomonas sp. RSW2]|uniref:DUF748 domain-containing protein n=1 Tax=Marinomonas maritima TaxID=2940935 RepID=A0ABT5WCY5_9GAMM|nr:DUF748 domain-containing protein [Marinomonas maritima]MDE8602682.1 DUF748 domain-containing protein [Marinomonas maritima]